MANPKCDVYFFEAFDEEASALQRFLAQADPDNAIRAKFTWKAIQEAIADGDLDDPDVSPARVVSLRTQSVVPKEWAVEGLDGLLTRSTGFDHIQSYRKMTGQFIAGGYLPLYCNRAVAEQAILLVLGLARKLPRQLNQFARFHRDGITGAELEGKTIAVFGVGNIGYEVVRIGKGFGMNVLGVDLDPSRDDVEYTSADDALQRADFVVCAMDLNESTRGYFSDKRLRLLKQGAVFVNVSRGEISPTSVLQRFLEEGHLGGVGLDAFDGEQELGAALRAGVGPKGEQAQAAVGLMGRPDVMFTPHNAFNTIEAVERKSDHSIQSLLAFLQTGSFAWPVE